MVKLNNKKIGWIVKHIVDKGDVSVKQAAMVYSITRRRVQQLVKEYKETGKEPVLKWNRRPRTYLSDEQKRIIDKVWEETRRGARLLYYELKKRGHLIPKNKIHTYLRETRRTIPNPRKQRKRKRCRYERKHTGDLLHSDWHRKTENHPHVIAWLDDASRKVYAGGEFKRPIAPFVIKTFRGALAHAEEHNLTIKQVNTDRDSTFFGRKGGKSAFQILLEKRGIQHIPSRVKNPQTNGKLERFWFEYDKHRERFSSFQEFVSWYNGLIHGELNPRGGVTPAEAFVRKLPPESILGLFTRIIGW